MAIQCTEEHVSTAIAKGVNTLAGIVLFIGGRLCVDCRHDRVVDRVLQRMRRRGVIVYEKKTRAWRVA